MLARWVCFSCSVVDVVVVVVVVVVIVVVTVVVIVVFVSVVFVVTLAMLSDMMVKKFPTSRSRRSGELILELKSKVSWPGRM